MDAVLFLNEVRRMCKTFEDCSDCPIEKSPAICPRYSSRSDFEEAVEIVERWSKEHPAKTRQSEFLEHYPNAELTKSTGALVMCPAHVFGGECSSWNKAGAASCDICCKNFWLAPVEEEDE